MGSQEKVLKHLQKWLAFFDLTQLHCPQQSQLNNHQDV